MREFGAIVENVSANICCVFRYFFPVCQINCDFIAPILCIFGRLHRWPPSVRPLDFGMVELTESSWVLCVGQHVEKIPKQLKTQNGVLRPANEGPTLGVRTKCILICGPG